MDEDDVQFLVDDNTLRELLLFRGVNCEPIVPSNRRMYLGQLERFLRAERKYVKVI